MGDILKEGLSFCGIDSGKIEILSEKMEKYINEIILFNSAYNLTNTSDREELIIRHVLDSLAPFKIIRNLIDKTDKSFVIGDIGSGGGLPGIPLAAAFPEVKFVLVERMSKRCAFLENCALILGLQNVTVLNKEAEKAGTEVFDLITFRAFRPLDQDITKTLLKITKTDGFLLAYKAKIENIKEEMEGIKNLVPEYKVEKLEVPGLEDSQRNLVIIPKK